MLVLTRKLGEKVVIDGNITVTVVEVKGDRVRLAFSAPDAVRIMRSELVDGLHQDDFDRDLHRKPAEWHEAEPCLVL